MPKTLCIMIVALLLDLGSNGTAFPALAVSEANPNSSLRVRFQKALVSIEAKEVSWVQLLEDLSRKSGIVFHTRTPIEGPVTVSFRDLPLDRALQHLFGRDANFMFVYGNPHSKISSAGLPAEVWIFGGGQRAISQTFGPQDAEPDSEDANDPAQKMLREFERNPQAARDAARRHADPAIRELAIKYLGEQTTEEGMTVLLDVLRDGDPHMRQNALDALGPSVENDPRVRKVMTQVMETTKDPDVRQFVSDALGVAPEKDKVGF